MGNELGETEHWLHGLRRGDADALAALLDYYRPRLRQMVRLRMDRQVAARVDPSDVIQEVYLDAKRQVQTYLRDGTVDFYVWLRGLAGQRLANVHRRHLRSKCRSAWREVPLPAESSMALAKQLLAGGTSPSRAVMKEELRRRVQQALEKLQGDDREVILMRHFEEMSNREVAQAIGLSESGATMRYGRALFRLKEILLADSDQWESRP
ncbi:MAG: sigma-70 family RNA polymerase sigma factor [Planctomycetota bacterium]|jgi:RNA polymerase sigma-70 factor (ECF subfamily)